MNLKSIAFSSLKATAVAALLGSGVLFAANLGCANQCDKCCAASEKKCGGDKTCSGDKKCGGEKSCSGNK